MLARADIDAVALVVPDHWHGIMTIAAARAGKDIYCEKPLSLTVAQGQAMVRAVRQHGRILQTGSHFRSSPANRLGCELVRNFLDSVKTRRDPIEPVEIGHRTATLCHLGNIAMLLKRRIRWDPQRETIVGDDEAAAMLARPMRAPWHL